MSGKDVITPCPISADGQRIVTVLSVPMATQALILATCVAPSASPTRPKPPSVKANISPAAPSTKPRRLTVGDDWCLIGLVVHGLALPSGALDGANNARIGAAATNVAVHVSDDLLARRLFVLRQQFRRLHDLTGLTVAALRHLLDDPRLLQRVAGTRRQPFDGRDLLAAHDRHLGLAGSHRLAVDMDRAGAAQAGAAAILGAGEFQVLAHDPKQGRVRLGLHAHRLAIDCKCDRRHGLPPWQTVHHTSGMFRLNRRMVVVFWIGRKACTRGAAAWRGFCSDRGRVWQTGDARSRTVYDDLAFARNVRKDR